MKVTAIVELELPDEFEPGSEYAWDAQVYEGICNYAIEAHSLRYEKYNSRIRDYHSVWLRALRKSQWKFGYKTHDTVEIKN